jgi:diguanylate cyclase (GGDEF)-like protein
MATSPATDLGHQLRRERLLDMEGRIAVVRRRAFAVLALSLIASGPWLGFWFLVPLGAAGVAFSITDRMLRTARRPERWAGVGWGVAPLAIAVSVALTGGDQGSALCWFALPVVTLGARFETRGVRIGVAYTLALELAVCFGVDHDGVIDDPTRLIAAVALVLAIAILTDASTQSEREHRRGAVMDPLTGLLNRSALAQRFDELEQQARQHDDAPLGFLIADIDHFKAVNDEHGHPAGDAVLKDVAYEMRKALRAFDLIYRVGGEEFVVLLPGADLEKTIEVGERLRAAVAASVTAGVRVTLSAGAATATGRDVRFTELYARADAALLCAKRGGRDRVVAAGDESAAAALVPA